MIILLSIKICNKSEILLLVRVYSDSALRDNKIRQNAGFFIKISKSNKTAALESAAE